MTKLQWLYSKRYKLSADGAGLLRYIDSKNFYHIHSDEMTSLEMRKHRVLGKGEFA